jgi:hypothetical protein
MSVDANDPREALFVFLLSLESCRLASPPQAVAS